MTTSEQLNATEHRKEAERLFATAGQISGYGAHRQDVEQGERFVQSAIYHAVMALNPGLVPTREMGVADDPLDQALSAVQSADTAPDELAKLAFDTYHQYSSRIWPWVSSGNKQRWRDVVTALIEARRQEKGTDEPLDDTSEEPLAQRAFATFRSQQASFSVAPWDAQSPVWRAAWESAIHVAAQGALARARRKNGWEAVVVDDFMVGLSRNAPVGTKLIVLVDGEQRIITKGIDHCQVEEL